MSPDIGATPMSSAVEKISELPDLTPSEVVLLHCDRFAPVPPKTRSSRIGFEVQQAFFLLIFEIPAMGLACGLSDPPGGTIVRVIAGLVAVGWPVGWWFLRRSESKSQEVGVSPLNRTRKAVASELLRASISAALLANEQCGALSFEIEHDRIHALFRKNHFPWPPNSLEEQLLRDRNLAVSELVHDWLADNSHFPESRAFRLLLHNVTLREKAGAQFVTRGGERTVDWAPVESLIRQCRDNRPKIWELLQKSIDAGLKQREVPPRFKTVAGRVDVPEYFYEEAPVGDVERVESAAAVQNGMSAIPGDSRPVVARAVPPVASLTILVAAFSGIAVALHYSPGNLNAAIVNFVITLTPIAASRLMMGRWKRLSDYRQKLGLVSEGYHDYVSNIELPKQSALGQWLGLPTLAAVMALLAAIWGFWLVIAPILIVGAHTLKMILNYQEFKKKTTEAAVRARVEALAKQMPAAKAEISAAGPTPIDGTFEPDISRPMPERAESLVPGDPIAAQDLPSASPETTELLGRWQKRRLRLNRIYWVGLGTLILGYAALVEVYWNFRTRSPWINEDGDYVPAGLLIPLAIMVFVLAWIFLGDRNDPEAGRKWRKVFSDDGEGISRHGTPTILIGVWRILILFEAPLLLSTADAATPHAYFAATSLLLLVAHWLGMEWACSKAMKDLPVPMPRDLLLLRVFGSPAYRDLAELMGPWLKVGNIVQLEGPDTVAESQELQDAVEAGNVDRALVSSLSDVEKRTANLSAEPDPALCFRRLTFQCTNAVWQPAVQFLLARSDAVMIDLSSFSTEHQGSAWELGQLLDRVPLRNVTLLVNDSTDLNCLRKILDAARQTMAETSPNRSDPLARWQLIRIGGLSARQPNESYYEWKRRMDRHLDSNQLLAWLWSTTERASQGEGSNTSPTALSWGQQARWPWLAVLAISAWWAFVRR
jgi:hypothetical protein